MGVIAMTTNSYGSLKQRPLHPKQFQQEDVREKRTFEVVDNLLNTDKAFILEQRKQHQHRERLLSAYLELIREFDYLPKRVLLDEFSTAVKHIYASNEEDKRKEQEFMKITDKVCENLQEEN
jgi:hypothetical protein